MKKDIWKQLKKQNNGRQLNLEVSDQKYIDKVTAYAVNQGVGMMETEIIRKDLIGMESGCVRGLYSESQGQTVKSYRYQIVGLLLHNPLLQELQKQ